MPRGRAGHARVVILTITPEELTAVLDEFGPVREIVGSGCWTLAESEGHDHPVAIAQSPTRGSVPAGRRIDDLIEAWEPEYVLLVGTAGAITRLNSLGELENVGLGDVVIVDYVHYGGFVKRVGGLRRIRYTPLSHPSIRLIQDFASPLIRTPWGENLGIPRPDQSEAAPGAHMGEIVSVDFVAGDGQSPEQYEVFEQYDHGEVVDMESYGVARSMHAASTSVHYAPAWLAVKAVSDRSAATPEAQDAIGVDNDEERKLLAQLRLSQRSSVRPSGRGAADPRTPQAT